jgi:hypothetical protein
MKYYYDTRNKRFTVQMEDYRFFLDTKTCFMGTNSFGIYFTHHVNMPVSRHFFVPSTCGLDVNLIKKYGIKLVTEKNGVFRKTFMDCVIPEVGASVERHCPPMNYILVFIKMITEMDGD